MSPRRRRRSNTASHYVRNLLNLATFLVSVSPNETPSGDHKPLILTTNRKDAMQRVCDNCSSSMVTWYRVTGEKLLGDSARRQPHHLEIVSIILHLVKKFRLNEAWNSPKYPYLDSILNQLNQSRNFIKMWLYHFSQLIPSRLYT